MNVSLRTDDSRPDGIFGAFLNTDTGAQICVTLEHAYQNGGGSWVPKLVRGATYTCKRRFSPRFQCDVFEITGVPNATLIEIHPGNFDADSEGCVCVGMTVVDDGKEEMITNSRKEFAAWMALQEGVDEFLLTVL